MIVMKISLRLVWKSNNGGRRPTKIWSDNVEKGLM